METVSSRQVQVDRYLKAAMIGTVAVLFYPLIHAVWAIFGINMATTILTVLGGVAAMISLVGAFIYLTIRRSTDEYTLSMWHAGTTTAFFSVLAWLLVGSFIETAIIAAYVATDPAHNEPDIDFIRRFAVPVTLGAFFVGFHVKRLRGAF